MASAYKVKKLAISTNSDIDELEGFLSEVSDITFIVCSDGALIIIYQE